MNDLKLSWPRPAQHWVEAAPVGNGRLGAMVFGGTRRARWQINDSTVWSGTPDGPRAGLAEVLAVGAGPERIEEVRRAIRSGDYQRAESLLMSFEGCYSQEYLPFADLWMSLDDGSYHGRTLNLDNGVVAEQVESANLRMRRLTWASRPAGVLCVSVIVDGSGDEAMDLRVELTSPLRVAQRSGRSLGVEIPVDGAPLHEPEVGEPLRYADEPVLGYDPFGAVAMALDTDGDVVETDGVITVRGLRRMLITLASSTSAADVWSVATRSVHGSASRAEHLRRAEHAAESALALGADRLLSEHEADLRGLLGGTAVTIGAHRAGTYDVASDILSGLDEQLTATVMVQLGRYLLASASRPGGGPPANLQGIWNQELRPAWSSNYTLNINTEMNYWGAGPAGLGECHEPLVVLVERLAETGSAVAQLLYGARGWVAHHNTDPWGWALPVGMGHGNPSWAIWMMGGVWLTRQLWDHFEFSQDIEFLRERAWPLVRGSARFCLDWLVDGEDGLLDTIPSTSPENLFVASDGTAQALSVSAAMDMALIRALFECCLAAAQLLGYDGDPVIAQIREALPRLRPVGLTSDGRLREWSEDHPALDPHHRHMSHLVTVYPLGQIDPETTPGLAAAAARTLDERGPGAMGWSWAWKIALRARLGDAQSARALLLEATRPLDADPDEHAPAAGSRPGGLLPNLFSSHPPFQIDGNYGLMAAVLEMLVQSRPGLIRVLPALPDQWPDGSCRGVRCRGGLAVDLGWRDGALTWLIVRRLAGADGPVSVQYGRHRAVIHVALGEAVEVGPELNYPLSRAESAC